jgi:hypothetical protein
MSSDGLHVDIDAVVTEQYAALQIDVRQRRRRCNALRELLDHLEAQMLEDEHRLAQMETALGLSPQMSLEQLDNRLRGRRLLEVAVDLLRSQVGSGHPIHYRAWYDLVRDAGHHVGGKDPVATFLAQVNRAPEVEHVGKRSGLYQLRAA